MSGPSDPINDALTPQDALVAVMIATCVSDENVKTAELMTIDRIVNHLPIFAEYDDDRTRRVANMVFELFEDEDGLDALFGLVRSAMPEALNETAYALACDVAAADGQIREEELRMLEEIRHELDVSRLNAAAIERGARARHMTV